MTWKSSCIENIWTTNTFKVFNIAVYEPVIDSVTCFSLECLNKATAASTIENLVSSSENWHISCSAKTKRLN